MKLIGHYFQMSSNDLLHVQKDGLKLQCIKTKRKQILGGNATVYNFLLSEHNQQEVSLDDKSIELMDKLLIKVVEAI